MPKQAQSIARQFNLMPSALDQSDYNMLQRDFLQHAQEMSTKLSKPHYQNCMSVLAKLRRIACTMNEIQRANVISRSWTYNWFTTGRRTTYRQISTRCASIFKGFLKSESLCLTERSHLDYPRLHYSQFVPNK